MHNNEIYVSLDIGTSTVKVIIGEMVNDSLNIIGVGNVASEGLKKGHIVDIDQTVQSIRKAIGEAERMVGMEIRKVIVGVSANHVMLQPCHGVVAVSNDNKEITEEDKTRVRIQAELVTIPADREIIDVIPIYYKVDEIDEIIDPKGMTGVRLEMMGILVTGLRTILHNTLRAVERAGLEITDIALQPMAAGSLILSRDEQNLGIAMVDIGGGSTSVAVFGDGQLLGASVIPIGGDSITKDLSIVLKTTKDEAEKIKIQHGHAFIDGDVEEELIKIPVIGSDRQQTCTQFEVADIIEARLSEIFELVQSEIQKMGIQEEILGGYVLTGGVVKTPGILDLAQHILQNRVRGAEPDYIGVREPQYTTSVGLITYACKKARLQGLKLGTHTISASVDTDKRVVHKSQPKERVQKNPEDKVSTKVKRFLVNFFE